MTEPAEAELATPHALDPDRELVDRWQAGDESAFDALVKLHQSRVYGLLVRMLGSRDEAEDAAQEAFLNLHRHGQRFRGDARFSTFLYRVAVNAALNRRRTLGRRRAQLERLEHRQASGHDLPTSPRRPDRGAADAELRERLESELEALAPALRAPLVMYDVEGMAYSEIARVLRVAEGTVKSRIHRARRALREQLRDLVEETGELGDGAAAG